MSEDEAWRDVPVTFGELYDILSTLHIHVSGSVGGTGHMWKESIKTKAQSKLYAEAEAEKSRPKTLEDYGFRHVCGGAIGCRCYENWCFTKDIPDGLYTIREVISFLEAREARK